LRKTVVWLGVACYFHVLHCLDISLDVRRYHPPARHAADPDLFLRA
jgi:hypothetical protein